MCIISAMFQYFFSVSRASFELISTAFSMLMLDCKSSQTATRNKRHRVSATFRCFSSARFIGRICQMSCWPLRACKLPIDFLSVGMEYANRIKHEECPVISWLLFFPSSSIGSPSMPMQWGVTLGMKTLELLGDLLPMPLFVLMCHEQECRNVPPIV